MKGDFIHTPATPSSAVIGYATATSITASEVAAAPTSPAAVADDVNNNNDRRSHKG